MNKATVIVTGVLKKEPELRYAASGTAVVNFALPVSNWKRAEESWEDVKSTWFNFSAFGKQAEYFFANAGIDTVVNVVASPNLNVWDKDGEEQQTLQWNVSDVSIISGRVEKEVEQEEVEEELPF